MRILLFFAASLVVVSLMATSASAQFTVPLDKLIFRNNQNSSYNSTTGKITMTLPQGSYTQSAYYPSYLRLLNQTYFEVHVAYEFDEGGPGDDGADGFAFVLHNQGFGAIGDLGANLGVPAGAFGIAFQTYTYRRIQIHLVNETLIDSANVPELEVPSETYVGPHNVSIIFNDGDLLVTIDGTTRFSGYVGPLDSSLLGNDVVMGFTGATGGAYALCYLSNWRANNVATIVLATDGWVFNTTAGTALTVSSAADGFLEGSSSVGVLALTFSAQCDSGSLAINSDGTFTYTPPATPGEANCNVSATDGSTQSNTISAKFYIGLGPNDEPVITLPSALQGTVFVYESDNYTLTLQDIVITDPDSSNLNLTMAIRISYESSDRFTYLRSQTELSDLFEQGLEIDFRPIPANTVDATVTITVNDNGNIGTGGALESTATINVEFSEASTASHLNSWVASLESLF